VPHAAKFLGNQFKDPAALRHCHKQGDSSRSEERDQHVSVHPMMATTATSKKKAVEAINICFRHNS